MRLVLEGDMHLLELAVPLDEAVVVTVDQNVVDRRVFQQRLERPEADHFIDDVADELIHWRR